MALRLGALALGSLLLAAVAKPLLRRSLVAPGGRERNGISVLLLFLFAIGVMGGARGLIAARPVATFLDIGAACLESGVLFGVTALVFLPAGRRTALSLGLCTAFGNLALVWAALGEAAGADFVRFFVAIQFPVYLMPIALRPLIGRFMLAE
jgi:BASS family bile acid:Na+ symporter